MCSIFEVCDAIMRMFPKFKGRFRHQSVSQSISKVKCIEIIVVFLLGSKELLLINYIHGLRRTDSPEFGSQKFSREIN